MTRKVRELVRIFLRALDDETIGSFQVMYYVIFSLFAATVIFVPHHHQDARDSLSSPLYIGWLVMNLISPPMTLLGMHLSRHTATKEEGEANPGVGAAGLRLTGDLGVWASVMLWFVVMFQSSWWQANLFVVYFMTMGVFGGFMFTLRSFRRLRQIEQLKRSLP